MNDTDKFIEDVKADVGRKFDATGTNGRTRPNLNPVELSRAVADLVQANSFGLTQLEFIENAPLVTHQFKAGEYVRTESTAPNPLSVLRMKPDNELAKYQCYEESIRKGFDPKDAMIRARNFS